MQDGHGEARSDGYFSDFGSALRYWRTRRGYSQLRLAVDASVSQRHLSFLESGRAQPSRDLILKLGIVLDVPLRQRNAMLLAAGFAPAYQERNLSDPELSSVMQALDFIVRSGRALYVGISSYSPELTREAAGILRELGTPLLIHQPSYSMLNRWIEQGLLDTLEEVGAGCIAFSPLAQGMLTTKYLDGVPEGSRAAQDKSLDPGLLTDEAMTA